ncbi:MAG: hypothetical protein IPP42_01895 [Saprospiraceae bacterium]|nr:hypothetical protein [Saprospiraceae bacterium]
MKLSFVCTFCVFICFSAVDNSLFHPPDLTTLPAIIRPLQSVPKLYLYSAASSIHSCRKAIESRANSIISYSKDLIGSIEILSYSIWKWTGGKLIADLKALNRNTQWIPADKIQLVLLYARNSKNICTAEQIGTTLLKPKNWIWHPTCLKKRSSHQGVFDKNKLR